MLLNLIQWFGLNTRWPLSNYVSRMPGLYKYLVSSQKWEHYKLYLVPYCCFNSISVFHQQGSLHSLEIWNISTLSWKEPIFQLIKTVTNFLFHDLPWWWSVQQFQEVIRTSCVWTLSNFINSSSQRKTTSLVSADLHWHWHLSHCWQLLPQPQWCPHNVTPLCFSILESC